MRLDSNQIAKILPQSYPFLMIDRVVDFKKGESLTAVKNITGNEWMFGSVGMTPGANPERRLSAGELGPSRRVDDRYQPMCVFPETLLIEAAAQAAILFYKLNNEESSASFSRFFLGQAKAEFARSARSGEQLTLRTLFGKMLKTGGYMDVEASVKEEKIADVQIFYSLR